uniref:Uncharacterized protein n=1 Tax=Glossina pallidipes TaxID=7398 RepID=A0A1A9ZK29_GLOPL
MSVAVSSLEQDYRNGITNRLLMFLDTNMRSKVHEQSTKSPDKGGNQNTDDILQQKYRKCTHRAHISTYSSCVDDEEEDNQGSSQGAIIIHMVTFFFIALTINFSNF